MKKIISKEQLIPFIKDNIKEFDTVFLIDENDEFTYENVPFDNVKIIKSSALVLKANETVKQICDYAFDMDKELPETVKFVFISQNENLPIPLHDRFTYLVIKNKGIKNGNKKTKKTDDGSK